ncbi:MAG: hypothetical protein AAGJ87_00260 [Pseudomonadota bacterium]
MRGASRSSPLSVLQRDIQATGVEVSSVEWEDFSELCAEARYSRKEIIFDRNVVSKHMFFVTSGVSASQFAHPNGQLIIDRFFETGDFCTTVRSAWRTEPSDDLILAVTPVEGILIPMDRWREEYLAGEAIGRYVREKIFRTLLFDADVIRVKSLNRTSESYGFLQERQPNVLSDVPQRTVAQFLGITPEGLSRFLRSRTV